MLPILGLIEILVKVERKAIKRPFAFRARSLWIWPKSGL
jgi:hypothetical protein